MTELAIQHPDDQPNATAGHTVGRAGAPSGNHNRTRHGLRSGRLPPGCERIGRDLNTFRRALEDAVLAVREKINQSDASLINAIIEHERHRRLCTRWLAISFDELTHAERISYSREAAKSANERAKLIAALKIDVNPADLWATIYSTPENELQTRDEKAVQKTPRETPQEKPSPESTEPPHVNSSTASHDVDSAPLAGPLPAATEGGERA